VPNFAFPEPDKEKLEGTQQKLETWNPKPET
jgi:hypothetical protein